MIETKAEAMLRRDAAVGGTVMMVSADRDRSDALLISADTDPVHVPLPRLKSDIVSSVAEMFLAMAGKDASFATARGSDFLSGVLSWLWDTIWQPVSEALPPAVGQRRIWLVPVGTLGLFPLHSAGRPGEPGALDGFVSSRIPTLRALARARDRVPPAARRQLTVALASAPGLPGLPLTRTGAIDLHGAQESGMRLLDEEATVANVLAALPDATWVHFACHARADDRAPSSGGLRLADGTLTIPEIRERRCGQAELAYLPTCSTTHRDTNSAGTPVTLAEAFHLAGFRHVIASLWPLNDACADEAARNFYGALPDGPGASGAAAALNVATRALRDRYPRDPGLWAPLIHSGPLPERRYQAWSRKTLANMVRDRMPSFW